ncbi:MAG TPA: N-acetylneuraminate synthase family protein [Pirellulales bacterium]|nr:N-acetylneuraminate synthase family protein [Pirellulales bacterium]
MNRLAIEGREIGVGSPVFVIAEIAQAHDGSLGTAHAYIDAAAAAGVSAVKFQTHIADAESTPGEPFRVHFSPQDATRYDYWRRMEFTPPQWRGLADHARRLGLVFLSTPFSLAAVDLLEQLDVGAWKVGSGEVTNLPMLGRMARTGRPVLLSSGMASWQDLDRAAEVVRSADAPLAILQCTTAYPCPPEKIGLNVMAELAARYQCPVGLSDHSGTIFPSLSAVTLGATVIEVHVVLSRQCFGPDVAASLTTDELIQLVTGIRFIERMLAHPLDKTRMAAELTDLRLMFGKSLVAARDLSAGHALTEEDVALKKPGTGIPAARLPEVLGRRLKQAMTANTFLVETNLD